MIALAYAVLAFGWIALSDLFLEQLTQDPGSMRLLGTVKGGLFVLVTAVGLYWIVGRQLGRSERDAHMLRFMVECVPEVLYRHRLAPARGFEFVSPAIEEVSGYPPSAFYKNPNLALELVHPDDRGGMEEAAREAAESGSPLELRWVRADGEVRWVEHRVTLVRDGEGRATGIVGIARDVSARKEGEEKRKLLEAAVEAAGESVLVTDEQGRIEYVNPAFERITGYTLGEIRGENPRILQSGEQPAVFYNRMWSKLLAGEAFHGEFLNRRKDGSLYRQEATITPILNGNGRPTRFVGVARDVTERRLLQGELREAQKAELLGQLSGGIAHDCRNVLGVIQAHADLGLSALDDGRSPREELEEIAATVQRGSRLLKGLLSLGRKGDFEFEHTSLSDLIREMRRTLQAVFPESVEVELDPGVDFSAAVDQGSVYQMVLNLATNARDAMPAGGRFTLRITRLPGKEAGPSLNGTRESEPESWIQLEVTDTGTGMDEETRRRIFEPLFTTKPPGKGTGLGMSMVVRLMEAHGGRITIESALGEGTTARLLFPPSQSPSSEAPTPSAPTTSNRNGIELETGTERILVVEDEEPLRRAMVRTLERLGYGVVQGADGKEALRLLAEEEVDLVITDLVMPNLGGRELHDEMQLIGLADLPVLFMSGYRAEDIETGSLPAASRTLLEKPWTLPELAARVREALGTAGARAGSQPTRSATGMSS